MDSSMDKNTFFNGLSKVFPHTPTASQNIALQLLTEFLLSKNSSEKLFLLKGFAGTGKTSIINCLIQNLPSIGHKAVLLAPTGRASKVMSNLAKQQAFTIHKHIYFPKTNGKDFSFTLKVNKFKNTLFIVDEASMIADSSEHSFEQNSLLDNLITYVYSGQNCKLLLMGDSAQLPPVNSDYSPALDIRNLEIRYNKEISHIELDEVVRQEKKSGILYNATKIRELLFNFSFQKNFRFNIKNFKDIVRLTEGTEIQDAIENSYSHYGSEQTAIIVRSNKRAVLYNKQIRKVILDNENDLSAGDLLMVVKNNYYWLKDSPEVSFIANGDTLEVLQIYAFRELYGFRFAEAKVQLVDYPNHPPFDTVLLLDTLESENPSLTYQESNRLYEEVLLDYQDETSAYKKYLKVKENPFFNALQVKFSYAITCHKSQGGQWDAVFIEKPYLPNGIDENYLRWLYTALTRAVQKVYLINFQEDDFK
ncbi:ATP-dependent exodeoxyribonuclease [Capnocytophaga felis]|uniref:ATP-dependent exodeoxyribonuclease n=2 Tax=Capnocytophaga felis TaxID=2267611 RepID=A0A5M4B8U3_9FLAO|nr:ATP-dependent exodeoxyribonuclease [Capnocytophaga felis]GET49119.1 ATP-dependent exodeoxyribonuclease [Capnocytophaga felis]